VCCSVLHCAAVCCSVLQCVAACCSVLQSTAEYYLQCVAVCCSVLQYVALCCSKGWFCVCTHTHMHARVYITTALRPCCSVVHSVAVTVGVCACAHTHTRTHAWAAIVLRYSQNVKRNNLNSLQVVATPQSATELEIELICKYRALFRKDTPLCAFSHSRVSLHPNLYFS